MDRKRLIAQLEIDERRSRKIYIDTVGKVTGGVGRNMTDRDFSDDEIDLMLANDIDIAEQELDRVLPWWRTLNNARQNAMMNMVFNLGMTHLLGFKKALVFLQAGRWDAAANEFLDSQWSRQVGQRAMRIANLIRTGEFA